MSDFLLELFSEEIPARMQADAARQLAEGFDAGLKKAGFSFDPRDFETFVTPRRLAIWIKNLPARQADVSAERKGPRADAPEAAIAGFLKSTGLSLEQLENRDGVYFAVVRQKGRDSAEVLKEMAEKILADFSWPKSMRWGAHEQRWVRPLHSILCLFDSKVVPVCFGPVKAGNTTRGHRFLAPDVITVTDAAQYEAQLLKAFVIADAQARKEKIRANGDALAAQHGLSVKADEGLLNEVTGLVEWPVALIGRIDEKYMDLPPEVLVSEMRGHQKYFALQNADGSLADRFLITANMETTDGGKAIIAGNERVLRARLADGRFFWDQDRKKSLEEWAQWLASVTYHAKLGTVAQKAERVGALAEMLAKQLPGADVETVRRAAKLAKADLVTGMVGEFPELQGVMGRYYAVAQNEKPAVADAIRDHYKPLGPTDSVPNEPTAVCVALADKLDTLAGMFAIGEKPTGSKDPFALRRAGLGIIRIVLENGIRINLKRVLADHCNAMQKRAQGLLKEWVEEQQFEETQKNTADLLTFLSDRLKVQLKDQGVRHDLIAAVFDLGEDDLVRLVARVNALQYFLATDDGANLLAAYKRAANILAIEEKKDKTRYDQPVIASALAQEEERGLHDALTGALDKAQPLVEKEDFTAAMAALSALRAPVDAFFDKVLVNDKDAAVRANRLNLLASLRATLDSIANFALIEG